MKVVVALVIGIIALIGVTGMVIVIPAVGGRWGTPLLWALGTTLLFNISLHYAAAVRLGHAP